MANRKASVDRSAAFHKTFTATVSPSDLNLREELIKLAHNQPGLRVHLLPLLEGKTAMEFATQEALNKYLKEHPEADRANHTVKLSEPAQEKRDKMKARSQEYRSLAGKAEEASNAAEKEGSAANHLSAMNAHNEAAAFARKQGDGAVAGYHATQAKKHQTLFNVEKTKKTASH